jgi:hypothetical protein
MESPSVKSFVLAALLTPLLALPAFAGCTEDFQAQTSRIPALQSAWLAKMGAPQAEKCAAHKDLVDAYVKLGALYKSCQTELQLRDADIQEQQQAATDEQTSYAADCGG